MRRWLSLALAVAAAAALSIASGHPGRAAAQPPAVSVFPVPGAHYAAPQTQITFRGVPISQLGPISVVGSLSGSSTEGSSVRRSA